MILSCSWISLPCLSSSVIIRFFPRLCVLLTFFKLLDASIVSRISSKLCFRISSFAFFFMVLHISTYSMWSLGVLFSIISLRFFIRALVGYLIPNVRTNCRKFTVSYAGPILWNSFPQKLRQLPSEVLFKRKLKYILLATY